MNSQADLNEKILKKITVQVACGFGKIMRVAFE